MAQIESSSEHPHLAGSSRYAGVATEQINLGGLGMLSLETRTLIATMGDDLGDVQQAPGVSGAMEEAQALRFVETVDTLIQSASSEGVMMPQDPEARRAYLLAVLEMANTQKRTDLEEILSTQRAKIDSYREYLQERFPDQLEEFNVIFPAEQTTLTLTGELEIVVAEEKAALVRAAVERVKALGARAASGLRLSQTK